MKKLFIIPILLLIVSCAVKEKPTFIKIENITVEKVTLVNVELTAEALFFNENDVSGSLESKDIEVFVNDALVANVSSESFPVPAKDTFTIPLKVVIPLAKVFENNKNGMLEGILNAAASKKVKVQYKGIITYSVLGFSYDYEVNQTQEIHIKL